MARIIRWLVVPSVVSVVVVANSEFARANWEETAVPGLLKEVKAVHVTLRCGPGCPDSVTNRISVDFRNISEKPIVFRYRFKCQRGDYRGSMTGQIGDSPWFADRVEGSGAERVVNATWEGCNVAMNEPSGGILIEVVKGK